MNLQMNLSSVLTLNSSAYGTLWINTPLARDLRAPFGGFKESGIGRDGPRQAAEFFTEEKATIQAVGEPPIRKLGQPKD